MRRPFDIPVFYPLEALESFDLMRHGTEGANLGLRELLRQVGCRATDINNPTPIQSAWGFYGASFYVVSTSPASDKVNVLPGIGMRRTDLDVPTDINGIQGLDDVSPMKPIVLGSRLQVSTPSPPAAPDQRIDIIEVAVRRDLYDDLPRGILDPTAAKVSATNKLTTMSFALDGIAIEYVPFPGNSSAPIGYKIGAPGPTPTAPATTPGYMKIAEILVDNATGNPTGTIRQEHIGDFRKLLFLGGVGTLGLVTQFPATLPTSPVIQQAVLPPGLRVAVHNAQATGTARANVYLLNNIDQAATYIGARDPRDPSSFELPQAKVTIGVVDSAMKAKIESASTTPAQKVYIGQPVVDISVRIHKWNSTIFVVDDYNDAGFQLTATLA